MNHSQPINRRKHDSSLAEDTIAPPIIREESLECSYSTIQNTTINARPRHLIYDWEVHLFIRERNEFLNQPMNSHSQAPSTKLTIGTSKTGEQTTVICGSAFLAEFPHTSFDITLLSTHKPSHVNYASSSAGVPVIDISNSNKERTDAHNHEYGLWVVKDPFERVERFSVATDSKIIGSHTVYRRKDDGAMKARIATWGHRDEERNELCSDSPWVNIEIFRLVLSLSTEYAWPLVQMDISPDFIQESGFDRPIFVKPPKAAEDPQGLQRLKADAYDLFDSGRLWYLTGDHALVSEHQFLKSR